MNLYICQTVRHLLISLLHAAQSKLVKTRIVINFEHQNLKKTMFDESILSSVFFDIEIIYLSEGKVVSLINSDNLLGKNNILSRNLYIGKSGIGLIHEKLKSFLPISDELFIFHDQVFLSKIFKSHRSVTLFDDGLANYSYKKERHPLKIVLRLLQFKHPIKYAYGEHTQIAQMLLTHGRVEDLPKHIRFKARVFNFQNYLREPANTTFLKKFFKLKVVTDTELLILTQNLDGAGVYKKADKLGIYEVLIKRLISLGFSRIAIKIHPSEEAVDYSYLVNKYNLELIDSKVPFELISIFFSNNLNVVSLYSSSEILMDNTGVKVNMHNILKDGWKGWPPINAVYERINRLLIDVS